QPARAADRQFEAFAAERLDQHAELELAAAGDFEGVAALSLADVNGDVALGLALQPVADDAALDLVAVLAGERAVIDRKAHRQGRRVGLARRGGLPRRPGARSCLHRG